MDEIRAPKLSAHKMDMFFFRGIAKKWFVIWGPGRTYCSVRRKSRARKNRGPQGRDGAERGARE